MLKLQVKRVVPLLAMALGALAAPALAQKSFPARPITLVVPGGAGSSTDNIARAYAERLGQILGQSIILDNKTGANGLIGTKQVAAARPDGYTLLIAGNSILVLNSYTVKDIPYDIEKDFVSIGQVCSIPFGIVSNNEFAAHSISELINVAKGKEVFFATPGSASISRLVGEWLGQKTGVKLVNVAYPNSTAAHTDVIGNRVPLMIDGLGGVAPHVKSGRLRLLAVTTKERAKGFENTPTVAETIPGFVVPGVFAIVAPAGTPPDIVAALNKATQAAIKAPMIAERYATLGAEPASGPPGDLDKILKEQRVLFKSLADQAKLRPE